MMLIEAIVSQWYFCAIKNTIFYKKMRDHNSFHINYVERTCIAVNPYFVNDYKAAASRLTMRQITMGLKHILEADLKSKGIEGVNNDSKSILEELLIKLFTL